MRAVALAKRPKGALTADCFTLVEAPAAAPQEGEVRIRGRYLSLDPYMRGAIDEHPLHGAPLPIGAVMPGRVVGEVTDSAHPDFKPGDLVRGDVGWRAAATVKGGALVKIPAGDLPLSWHTGVFGGPGLTAWIGYAVVGDPKPGETVVVSSAAGGVGMVAGQLGRARGCHVIGIAGGAAKCALAQSRFGFDEVIDYKAAPDLAAAVKAAAPRGVDFYFDNVGERTLDAVLANLNVRGRVALCGHIAAYNSLGSPDVGKRHYRDANSFRWRLQGFSVRDNADLWPRATAELMALAQAGKLVQHETVVDGLAGAGQGLADLIAGRVTGKAVVKLA
jgi:NADPH-dependent curcumin reductase CurA